MSLRKSSLINEIKNISKMADSPNYLDKIFKEICGIEKSLKEINLIHDFQSSDKWGKLTFIDIAIFAIILIKFWI